MSVFGKAHGNRFIEKQVTGTSSNMYMENETIAKYEIMDRAPTKGQSIPIRLILSGYDLMPNMRDVKRIWL